MSQATGIEWTDATWNPVRGCSRISEGCRNCYAERQAARFSKSGQPFHGFAQVTAPRDHMDRVGGRRNGWTGRVELIPKKLDEPTRWRKPRRIFVNSMSDLFHPKLSVKSIAEVFSVMGGAWWHTYQILTKRPERMAAVLPEVSAIMQSEGRAPLGPVWKHVWLGVSVEDQATADERIPPLLKAPAAVRFVSYEPALGPVDFSLPKRRYRSAAACALLGAVTDGLVDGGALHARLPEAIWTDPIHGGRREAGIDWLIVGGESGPGARPFDVAWARSAVAHCKAAGVPVFVKQLGARPLYDETPYDDGARCRVLDGDLYYALRDRKGGDPSEWPEDLRVREFPEASVA